MSADLLERGLGNLAVAAALAVPAILAGWWGRRPALTHALWLLVLLKLVTPPVVGLPVRLLPPEPVVAEPLATVPAAPEPTPPAAVPLSAEPIQVAAAPPPPNPFAAMAGPPKTLRKVNELKFPPLEYLNAAADQAAGKTPAKATPPGQAATLTITAPSGVAMPTAATPRPVPSEQGADAPRSPEPAPFPWAAVALGAWAGGAALWLGLVAVRVRRFARVLRLADPPPAWFAAEVAAAADHLGLRAPPRVRVVPGAVAPMVWSLGRTTVYFPSDLLGRLSAGQRAALVTHELAHLRRGDHMARWLELAALALYWWCPLAWLARRELRRSEEECCDAWVVAARPAAGRTYASALLDTLDFLAGARPAPALATGMGTAAALRRRLLLILAGTTPKRLPALGRLAVVAAALLVLPLGPRLARLTAAPADDTKPTDAAKTPGADAPGSPKAPTATPRGEPLLYEPTAEDIRPRGLAMWGLAVSPDGTLAVTTHGQRESPGEVVLWDRAAGTVKATAGFPGGVRAAAFSPDGKTLATASYDGVFRLHDPATLAVWAAADEAAGGHKASSGINGVCFFRGGKYAATAGLDNLVHVWELPAKKDGETVTFSPVATLTGHTGGVLSVAASDDGKTLLSGSFDRSARAWDLPEKLPRPGEKPLTLDKPRQTFADHGNAVEAVAVSPDGSLLATGSWDAQFRVRDRENQVVLAGSFQMGVMCAAFSKDGKYLAAGTGDGGTPGRPGEVRVWDVADKKEVAYRADYPDCLRGLGFTPDGKTLVSSGQDGGLTRWPWAEKDLKTASRPGLVLPTQPFLAAAASPDGRLLAFAGESKSVYVLDREARKLVAVLAGHGDVVAAVAFAPDGKTLATGGYDKAVKLWDTATWAETKTLKGHTGWVLGVAFAPDGKTLATAGYDKTVRLWDAATGDPKATWKEHSAGVRAVAFTPDGKHLISGGSDRIVRVWDLAEGKVARQLKGHKGAVRSVAVSADGKLIATGGEDKTVKVWDTATGSELKSVAGLPDLVTVVRFSPRGQTLAAGTFAGPVVVLDPLTGRRRQTLSGPSEGVTGLVFGAGGQHLVVVSQDRTVRQWAAVKPAAVKPGQALGGDTGLVTAAALLPNGQAAVLGGADGKLSLWEFAAGGAKPLFHQPRGLAGGITQVAASKGGLIAAVGGNGKVAVVPLAQGRDPTWPGADGRFAAFAPDGKQLAVVTGKAVVLYEAATGKEVRRFEDGHDGPVLEVAFSPDGKRMVTAGEDTKLRLWDVASGEKKQETPPVGNYVTLSALSFDPEGGRVAVAAYGPDTAPPEDMTGTFQPTKSVRVYAVPAADAGDWSVIPVQFAPQPPDAVTVALPWVQGGKALLVASADGTLRVNEIEGGNVKETSRFRAHEAGVLACVATLDGQVVVTTGEDGAVRRWKLGGPVQAPGVARLIPPGAGKVWESLFTPDGKYLVAAGSGDTKAFRVYATGAGAVAPEVGRHPNTHALAYSPDGRWLVSGHDGGVLVVRDAATGKEARRLTGHGADQRIQGIGFAAGGAALVSVTGNPGDNNATGQAFVWDFAAGTVKHRLDAPARAWAAAVRPDGKAVAVPSADGKVRVWDVAGGTLLHTFEPGGNTLAYSPDGTRLALGNGSGTVRVIDAETGAAVREITLAPGLVPSRLLYGPDGAEVVVAAWKGYGQGQDVKPKVLTYKVDDPAAGPREFPAPPQSVLDLAFLDKDTLVVAGGVEAGKGTLSLFDWATGKPVGEFGRHRNWAQVVAASPDGKRLVSSSWGAGDTDEFRLWSAAGLRPVATVPVPGAFNYLSAGAVRPDGKQLVLGGWPKYLAVWDFTDPTKPAFVKELAGHAGGLRSVAYRPDGKQFVTADEDGAVKVWDAETLEPVVSFQASAVRVNRAKFTPDGTQIVTVSGRWEKAAPGEIKVWNPKTGKETGRFPDQTREVWDIGFVDGGQRWVTVQGTTGQPGDSPLKVWNPQTKEVTGTVAPGVLDAPRSLAVSPDGQLVAVGSSKGPVKLLARSGWDEVAAVPDLKKAVFRVEFSPDGKMLASSSEEHATVLVRVPATE